MAERNEAVTEQAVRDGSATYSVEPDIATAGDVPPGYKRTEVGVIPRTWDVCELREGAALHSGHHVLSQWCNTAGQGVPYLTGPADFPGGVIRQTKFTTKPTTICEQGDLLLTVKGSGAGALIEADGRYCISRQLMAIRVKTWNPRFIYYSLLENSSALADAVTGLIPGLSRGDVLSQALPTPSSATEQRAIATALSDADALIESLDQLIAKKRVIKQAAMQQLLTGQTRLPGFTGEWEMKPFGQVLERRNVKSHQIQTVDYRASGNYPVVDQGQEKIIGFTDRHDKVFSCPKTGVIVFGDHTCIVKFVDFDFAVGADGTQVLEAKPGQCTRFYGYHLEYDGVQPTGYNRHFKFLKEKTFPVPETGEQIAIAKVLSDMDTEIEALERRRDKARQIKQSMMQQLLTGQVRLVATKGEDGE
ncbi:restriction endonuclease subunit S [Halorhodospira halochloris]|uniref:restriction endonuclease subunit S n=1 Tax=Halorhodospira halochloris TaxID=1052 RepID=UPI001EE8BE2C|nr:restriction endonuclease subunit S [Halorhodospira halochloris]MCG5531460.1 restriction endonuclease subunit S [Halorhodospira halochloris]